MPWFDYYGEGKAVSATDKLKALVGRGKSGQAPQPDNEPVAVDHVVPLGKGPRRVRECS